MSGEEHLIAAGRDLVAHHKSDAPAADLGPFVITYFPKLKTEVDSRDLIVTNLLGERLYVRRIERKGHKGWESLSGSDQYQISEMPQHLDVGGGARRTTKALIDHLAQFSNRTKQA